MLPLRAEEHFVYSLEVKRDWQVRIRYECPAQLREWDGPAVQSAAIEGRPDPLVRLPIIIAAVFLVAGNEDFGFDPAGYLDPFMHLGYFWHYPAHLPALDLVGGEQFGAAPARKRCRELP